MEISAKDISENEKNGGVLVRYWDFNAPISTINMGISYKTHGHWMGFFLPVFFS